MTNGASNGYHAPTPSCPGCRVATVTVRQHLNGWWTTTYAARRTDEYEYGSPLAQVRCDSEDEARTVAALAAQAHGCEVHG